jgi:hypothetical protein
MQQALAQKSQHGCSGNTTVNNIFFMWCLIRVAKQLLLMSTFKQKQIDAVPWLELTTPATRN